ncbi:hypothetical protein [Streptomyces viridosporus]|uniref:Uncharacterized protein n=1 Tax=Streptomyces viridosporus T7A TaxID=665577 RepID=A0ABX6ANZ4_STRVD|nr:hypothetical protein [Streptomyces viridosporus]QEU88891.1 hypothetical protein CP969_32550 [Streptomyces viridosporus T7A]
MRAEEDRRPSTRLCAATAGTCLLRAFAPGSDADTWYLRDLRSVRTGVVIASADGAQVQADTGDRPLDAWARTVAFSSAADHLALGPRSPETDAHVRRLP